MNGRDQCKIIGLQEFLNYVYKRPFYSICLRNALNLLKKTVTCMAKQSRK